MVGTIRQGILKSVVKSDTPKGTHRGAKYHRHFDANIKSNAGCLTNPILLKHPGYWVDPKKPENKSG
jgi:hypothetical protein